ncbi:MAG: MBL fold metallo-hydrolase [Myxococcales bacterium]|nr:MBL fold metallo-hydrolase [Myxococcales bacterium]
MADRTSELARLHRRVRIRRTPSLLLTWLGRYFVPPRAVAIEPLPAVVAGEVAVTFGGHASALIRYADRTIALDPMLGRWVGGVHRAVAPGLSPTELAATELVLISHGHADHLHPRSLGHVPVTATVVGPSGTAARLGRRFARVIELGDGAAVELEGVRIEACAVAHGGDGPTLAYTIAGDGPRVFACADGAYGPQFEAIGARAQPDIALLPIGGFWPRSFRARHMSPLDALYAFEDLRARVLVPIHHGAFALSYERLGEPVRWLRQLIDERDLAEHVRILAPGQSAVWRGGDRLGRGRRDGDGPAGAERPALLAGPWLDDALVLGADVRA